MRRWAFAAAIATIRWCRAYWAGCRRRRCAAAWRRPMPGFTSRSRSAPNASRWMPPLEAGLTAAALVLPVLGCVPTAELSARRAVEPEAVAVAVCREVAADAAVDCENVQPAQFASEIAYATCLDYNRRDPRTCSRLRQAYEDDIRAQLAARQSSAAETSLSEKRRALSGLQAGERQRTAEALYRAANSDADTFQAALLIPEVRKKIEAALGKRLSDAQLRALVENNRAEAVYWYGYAQNLRPARENAEEKPGG